MNKISRRQFLFSPLLLLPDEVSEEKIRGKVLKSKNKGIEKILKFGKSINLSKSHFHLDYNLFEDDSERSVGTASLNFNPETRIMDVGIDEFLSFEGSLLWLLKFFSDKHKKMYDLQNVRSFTKFDDKFMWIVYGENIPKEEGGRTSLPIHYYERKKHSIILDSKKTILEEKATGFVHNPLSAFFEILGGNLIDDFKMVASGKISDVKIKYQNSQDYFLLQSNLSVPLIGNFKNVFVVLYSNVPVSGYIGQIEKNKESSYIRGELSDVKIIN